jgi:PTH1 family peptidyl-tRNA hydrolase
MQIIAGLGNPGKKYTQNRHNIGFKILESIAELNNFQPWRKKFQSQITEGHINSKKIMLIKPETFMNNSGNAIQEVLNFYKLNVANLTVIHDDLDLRIGKIKLKIGGSSAGHNGLKSIDQHVGSSYIRLRVGISRPVNQAMVAKYVLSDFSDNDNNEIEPLIIKISGHIEKLFNENQLEFINQINQTQANTSYDNPNNKSSKKIESNDYDEKTKLTSLLRLLKKFKN